ncbi:MAG TPA: hypothetical protein VGL46_11575 [Pseudonocardiaceae bacterium]|jgi:hypothetical protein
MSDALSLAELDGQHVDPLPARTVLSLFVSGGTPGSPGDGSDGRGAGSTVTNDGNGYTIYETHGIGTPGAGGTANNG